MARHAVSPRHSAAGECTVNLHLLVLLYCQVPMKDEAKPDVPSFVALDPTAFLSSRLEC